MDPVTIGLIVSALASVAGSYLNQRSANRQRQQEWSLNRPEWERREAQRVARNQLAMSMLRRYGLEGSIDPSMVGRLIKPNPFPNAPQAGWEAQAGSALTTMAPYIYRAAGTPSAPEMAGPSSSLISQGMMPTGSTPSPVAGGTSGADLRLPGDTRPVDSSPSLGSSLSPGQDDKSTPDFSTSEWWQRYIDSLINKPKAGGRSQHPGGGWQ